MPNTTNGRGIATPTRTQLFYAFLALVVVSWSRLEQLSRADVNVEGELSGRQRQRGGGDTADAGGAHAKKKKKEKGVVSSRGGNAPGGGGGAEKEKKQKVASIMTKATADKKKTQTKLTKTRRVPDVLMGKGRTETEHRPSDVVQIALLGERNTGTTWMQNHLRDCFEHKIRVRIELVRHKHWFQHDIWPRRRYNQTLVVAQFRNPCQWADRMRAKSYRAPIHHKLPPSEWRRHVTTPWTMPRMDYDLELLEKHRRKQNGGGKKNKGTTMEVDEGLIPCHNNFTYNRINACLHVPYWEGERLKRTRAKRGVADDNVTAFSGVEPFYELRDDGSGEPYDSIMDMRSDKIRNFLAVAEWDWVAAVLPVQYEEMVRDGTSSLIRRVESLTGVGARCQPSPPRDRPPRALPDGMEGWMMENVDWETEALIGYESC